MSEEIYQKLVEMYQRTAVKIMEKNRLPESSVDLLVQYDMEIANATPHLEKEEIMSANAMAQSLERMFSRKSEKALYHRFESSES